MRLQTQLMLLYGVAAILVYVGSIAGIHNSVSSRFEEFARQGEERRQTDFVRLAASFLGEDAPIAERMLRGAMRRYGVRDARVYDPAGRLLIEARGEGGRGGRNDRADSVKEYAASLQTEEREVGSIVFSAYVRRPGGVIEEVFMDGVNSMLLYVSILAVLLLSLISWFVSRSIARPLESASRAAARIAGGEMDARLETTGRFTLAHSAREISALIHSFNDMADALELKERLRTRMTSDIAHELRTPVSILKAHLEGLRDGVLTTDAAQISSLLDETLRLEKIINDLRAIWELENAGRPHCAAIEIEPFMQKVIDRFRPLAEEKGIRIELSFAETETKSPKGLRVLADSAALHRVFDNLMQNALKYGSEHGKIELSARGDDGRICLCVADDGPGISPEALPLVFERFYRADEARARKSGGAGLGLAIAREAVEACGGSITAANRTDTTGAVFTVFLPAAQKDTDQGQAWN